MKTNDIWVIVEKGKDFANPAKAITFAFDTETQIYFDDEKISVKRLAKKIKRMNDDEKRRRIANKTWSWQAFDEINGFFMTNDFETWLEYCSKAGYKFGWCYNSTFDFAQIDYEILAKGREKWSMHEHAKKGEGYNKAQPFTYESLHNDMGARYAYKLWFPYKNADRHTYVHAIELHDFMKIITGGLSKLLKDLDVRDRNGKEIRKLTMEYQEVDSENLSPAEIDYCRVDVEGLYFAVKKFNDDIESQSNNESHIFGKETNIMTAGGFAKRELLRSLYPNVKKQWRLKRYQKEHPLSAVQDKFLRENGLYRGGISFVNPKFKGRMMTAEMFGRKMNRFDVNSEYPYSMAQINDLVGAPFKRSFDDYEKMQNKKDYEAVYVLRSVSGVVKSGYLGFWYDPFKRDFVKIIDEAGTHLMFERELNELSKWYDDLEYEVDYVILWKKGNKIYAPFVNENYLLKAKAKKEKNSTLQAAAKLKLNSSYGKLAERQERVKGHYELNEKTGAIHFVSDEIEETSSSSMNVAVGALITSFARCFILSKIREICGNRPADNFVYIDTDSIHAFADYDKADPIALGGLKLEAECEAVKYLLPKTYIDIENINSDGSIDFDSFEIHSKGVSVSAIIADLKRRQKGKKKNKCTLQLLDRKIDYGKKYGILSAMNVTGGKVLLPIEKYLATEERRPKGILTNYEGFTYLMEK